MADVLDWVMGTEGLLDKPTSVGWALTVTGLARLAGDTYTDKKVNEIIDANGVALVHIPGGVSDACACVHQRGGQAFMADPGSPWMWREEVTFTPKSWYCRILATKRWQNGAYKGKWQYRMEYHPSARASVTR